MNSLKELLKLK